MKFNTAIFYDIENLLKGYGLSQKIIQGLSLKEIYKQIEATEAISKVAIQRAYANWSDPRLGFMRNELLDLGIEPIQVFGFSYGGNKNVADIQLAVEVTDLLHTRPSIETFVIVSGDGGYASLAKKLHEYGKTVVGSGYKKSTNKILEAVCDHFIWIEDPESADDTPNAIQASDPRVQRMRKHVQGISPNSDQEALFKKVKEVINWMENDNEASTEIKLSGISPSVFRDAINAVVPGFDPIKFGFPKFLEFLRFALKDTSLGIWQSNQLLSDVKIGIRKSPLKNHSLMSDLEGREIHSIECYKSVLAHGHPVFKLPDYKTLKRVAEILAHSAVENTFFGEILEQIVERSDFGVDQESLKFALSCYISANSFEKLSEGSKLFEQKLTLKKEYYSYEKLLENLKSEIQEKIRITLGELKPEVFDEMFQ